jgi:hypothetical protein
MLQEHLGNPALDELEEWADQLDGHMGMIFTSSLRAKIATLRTSPQTPAIDEGKIRDDEREKVCGEIMEHVSNLNFVKAGHRMLTVDTLQRILDHLKGGGS